MARAFLAEERRKAISVLVGVDREEFDELFEEVVDLPMLDVTLQVGLPRLLSLEPERLRVAIGEDDEEAFEAAVGLVLGQLDNAGAAGGAGPGRAQPPRCRACRRSAGGGGADRLVDPPFGAV